MTAYSPAAPPLGDSSNTSQQQHHPDEEGFLSRVKLCMNRKLLGCWRMVRTYPRVLWVPLLVLAVLVVSGVVSVIVAADAQATSDKDTATGDSQVVAVYLTQALLSAAQASESLAGWISQYPYFPRVNITFNSVAAKLLVQVQNLSPETYLVIAPFGVYANVQPLNQFSASDIGYQQFNRSASLTETSLAQIRTGGGTLRGPIQSLVIDPQTNTSKNFILSYFPVMVPDVEPNEMFGIPWPQVNCPADVCYDSMTSSKFWGFAVARIPSDPLLLDGSSILNRLRVRGYSYRLFQTTNQTLRSTSPATPGFRDALGNNATLLASEGDSLVDPVEAFVTVPGVALFQPMTLSISKPGGWTPTWKAPMIAAVIVISAAIPMLIGLVMVWHIRLKESSKLLQEEKAKSDTLLYSMLPSAVADKLRRGDEVEATEYEEVAILFSDIVGFTEISATSSARGVCMMLNELYNVFDNIISEYPVLYKVETIGDAYMVVSNVSMQSEGHVDCMIEFAIRMQQAARTVKSTLGESISIRVGIHVGPAVASVIGAKMPRFCFFGDTVNTASRMESHGLPGNIHISSAACEAMLDKRKFAMQDRGLIQVKGKGSMRTYLISTLFEDPRQLQGREDSGDHSQRHSFQQLHSPFNCAGPSFTKYYLDCKSAVLEGTDTHPPQAASVQVDLAAAVGLRSSSSRKESLKSPLGLAGPGRRDSAGQLKLVDSARKSASTDQSVYEGCCAAPGPFGGVPEMSPSSLEVERAE